MDVKSIRIALALAAAVGCFMFCPPLEVRGAQPSEPQARTDISQGNALLLEASSPFEDMIEAALAGNGSGVQKALASYGRMAAKVPDALPAAARPDLEKRVAQIRDAEARKDLQAVAENAVEAYRILINGLNPLQAAVPVSVSQLDYVGFKQRVLLHAQNTDWAALSETVRTAQQNWQSLSPLIHDSGLRDAVQTMINGMEAGISLKHPAMAEFAARMDLALVDLIENYFTRG